MCTSVRLQRRKPGEIVKEIGKRCRESERERGRERERERERERGGGGGRERETQNFPNVFTQKQLD